MPPKSSSSTQQKKQQKPEETPHHQDENPQTTTVPSSPKKETTTPTSLVATFFRLFIFTAIVTIFFVGVFFVGTAACFTHRDPLAVYLEQHFMIDHATRQNIEREVENGGHHQNNKKGSSSSSTTEEAVMEARKEFLSRPASPLSSHFFENSGDLLFKDAILENTRNSFCRMVIEPVVFSSIFPFDGDYRGDYGFLFEVADYWLLPRFYGKQNFIAQFLGRTFASLRGIDLFGTKTMLGEKKFEVVSSSSSSKNTKNNKRASTFKLCAFATTSLRNSNKTAQDFDNTLAQTFDFISFNEMREIFPLRAGYVKDGIKVLSFEDFSSTTSSSGSSSSSLVMLQYLRYLYSLPLIHENNNNNQQNSKFSSDLTFLGEFLNGVISVPSSAAENNFATEKLRFAYPESLENDGVQDCCDGSDEDGKLSSGKNINSNNNCHEQLMKSHFLIRDKLARLSRAFQICIQRSRNNKDRMYEFRNQLEAQSAQLQPQFTALVERFQQLVPKYQQLHQVMTTGQASPKKQQKYQKIIAELQQIQPQLQQLQQYKSQADSMVSSVNSGGFGESGQFVSLFQHPESLIPTIEKNKKRQEYYAAKEFYEYNRTPSLFALDLMLERIQKPKQSNFACLTKRMSNKEIAGGSADPSGGSDQEFKICPFRYADGADVDQLRKYAQEMINYEEKLEKHNQNSGGSTTTSQQQKQKSSEEEMVSDDPDEEVRLQQQRENNNNANNNNKDSSTSPPPQPPQAPDSKTLGIFFGSLSYWPAFALAGRRSFYDVVPQMPSRFAQAKLFKSQREFSMLAQKAFEKFQRRQQKMNKKNPSSPSTEQFDPTTLFKDPTENALALKSQGSDVAQLLHDLVNKSVTAQLEKITKKRTEYIQSRKNELMEGYNAKVAEHQEARQQQKQQEQETSSEENNNNNEVVSEEDSASNLPESLKNFQLPSDDELGAAWDKNNTDASGESYIIDNYIEHRYFEDNVTEFLKSSPVVATDVSFFRHGEACWEGPNERTMAVFFACGEQDRIIDVREDGKCIYEAVIETPSACCQYANSFGNETTVKVSSTGIEVPKTLFRAKYYQRDNTLIRRYSAIEKMLEMWL